MVMQEQRLLGRLLIQTLIEVLFCSCVTWSFGSLKVNVHTAQLLSKKPIVACCFCRETQHALNKKQLSSAIRST